MIQDRITTLKERLTCFIAHDMYIHAFNIYVHIRLFGQKILCKIGRHKQSDWKYPTKFSKPHYMAKTKWRYCLRDCEHQETVIDMKAEVYQ